MIGPLGTRWSQFMETETGFPKQWKEVDVLAESEVRRR